MVKKWNKWMINDQKLGIIWMLNDPLTCFCLEFKTNDFCFKFLRFLWSVKQDIWFTFREFELPFIYGIIQIKIGMNIRILVDIKWETIWPGSDNTKDYSTTTTTTKKQQKNNNNNNNSKNITTNNNINNNNINSNDKLTLEDTSWARL